jgi:uncharacterized membrane protein YfcA
LTLLGWIGAGAVGLALGLLGSGGSTLTVPILVYLLDQEEKTAIAGSLVVVGTIALSGGIGAARSRRVDWRHVALFGLPGMAGTATGAQLARYVPGSLQLTLFALVALVAATLLVRGSPVAAEDAERPQRPAIRLAIDGIAVGLATGLVGVGGGFLIVPALIMVGGLPMHLATGTSLWIIAFNAFTGFFRYLPILSGLGLALDWSVLAPFMVVGSVASLVGHRLGRRLPQERLKRLFGWSLFALGLYVLARSLQSLFG